VKQVGHNVISGDSKCNSKMNIIYKKITHRQQWWQQQTRGNRQTKAATINRRLHKKQ